MAHLTPHSQLHHHSHLREFTFAAAVGTAMIICMPALAIAAFLLRGIVISGLAVVIATIAIIGVCELVWPRLPARMRHALHEYAGPAAFGLAMVVCMPLLAVLAFVVQGTVAALLAAAAITVVALSCGAAVWRHIALARHHDHNAPTARNLH